MSEVKVDTISERTSANGVAVDGVTIKDSAITVKTINLDGTVESSPAEGDIWYNNGKFYLGTDLTFMGSWSSGGNLATARVYP